MANYSLIALDMDGTLLGSDLQLSPGNRSALIRAHEAGKHVVLCTGRCLAELQDFLAQMPQVRYLVCENGSCVYDIQKDYTIHAEPVPPMEILHILALMQEENAVLQAFHDNRAYFNQPNGEWTEACGVGMYREIFNRTAVWDERLFDNYARKPFRIEKLNMYFRNDADRQRIHRILQDRPLKLADSMGFMLEVVSEHADKGIGLEKLCQHLNLPMEQTIAVGDSMNDIEALRAAGFSAAMGNACPEAKAAADFITDDCDHDGVARVIDQFLLA